MRTARLLHRVLALCALASMFGMTPSAQADQMTQVDDAAAMFTYNGFVAATDATAYQTTLHQRGGTTGGQTMTFQFTGYKFEIYGIRGSNWGDCQIYVDDMSTPAVVDVRGTPTNLVSNWNATRINQTLLCTWSDPAGSNQAHTVKLVRLDTNVLNAGSGTRTISFDFLKYYTADAVVPITGLTLSPGSLNIVVGNTGAISPVFTPANTSQTQLTWTSSDSAIATVANGVVTGVAPGSAVIRATSVSNTAIFAECAVTISPVVVTGVTIVNPLRGLLYPGQTAKMLGLVSPSNVTDKTLNWTSSDPNVATVDGIGLVTAVGPGNATITATSAAMPGKSDAAAVVVTAIPELASPVAVTPAAAPAYWRNEQADRADAFVEAVSTQVYFWLRGDATDFNHQIYFDRFDELKSLLSESGIRYARGRPAPWAQSNMIELNSATGVRFILDSFVDKTGSQATITQSLNLMRTLGAAIKYVEGPNEQDGNSFTYDGLTDTATDFPALAAYQRDFYAQMKTMPETAQYGWEMISPAPGEPSHAQRMTEQMWSYCDLVNIHSYTSGRMPTHVLDSANYGAVELGLPAGAGKRVAATEAGVTNAVASTTQQPGVSEVASAKYIPRQHFEYFNRGMAILPTFEFYDRAVGDNKLTVQNGNWGLVRNTGSPKPAFNTLRDIIRLVEDPSAPFTPQILRYGLSGDTLEVHHTLLQKHDGRFILALWKDAESFDNANRTNGVDLAPEPAVIGVHLARSASSVRVFTPFFTDRPADSLLPKGQTPAAEYSNLSAFTLKVPDHVILVEIALAAASAPEPAAQPYRKPLPDRLVVEAENCPSTNQGGSVVTLSNIRARSGKYVELRGSATGDWIEFEVNVPQAGLYQVSTGQLWENNNGLHRLSIDGVEMEGVVDQYTFRGLNGGSNVLLHEIAHGNRYFGTPGVKKFRFTVAGRSALSTGSEIAVDYILLTAVPPVPATVALGNLVQTYDGAPKTVSAATDPAGLPVVITYNGGTLPPVNAGTYAVAATIVDPDHNLEGGAAGVLSINLATTTFAFDGLNAATGIIARTYDGGAQTVTVNSSPAGVGSVIAYNGSTTAPTLPGTYTVTVVSSDPNYAGTATAVLQIGVTALVRHAPALNGDLDGSVQMLLPEDVTLNGDTYIAGDLLVPGSPDLKLNGHPQFGGVIDGPGAVAPTNHKITLNGNALLTHLVRRVDAIPLPAVIAPTPPAGTRDVALNASGQSAGDFATLRNLTLNGNVGSVAVPPGAYGSFTVNAGSSLVLGVAGSATPAIYSLQSLTINANAQVVLAGPVVLRLGSGLTVNGSVNASGDTAALTVEMASGGLTLNGSATLNGAVLAPTGTVTLNGTSELTGSVSCDRLTLNGTALLRDPAP